MRRLTFRCALWGHDDQIHWTRERIFLQCAECGRETAGWDVEPRVRPPRDEQARADGQTSSAADTPLPTAA